VRLAAIALLAACAASAQAEDGACTIAPYRGASSAEGAVAEVRMRNRGRPCAIPNYGVPNDKRNPADSGRILAPPAHGEARFVAPHAEYVPAPGFAGDDAFTYEAYARGTAGTPVRLRVAVKVRVLPSD
jgi:hypothetical protein